MLGEQVQDRTGPRHPLLPTELRTTSTQRSASGQEAS
eukprot:COSAG04_NODE_19418_length_416_cov_2.406940_1_plen_36_part_10